MIILISSARALLEVISVRAINWISYTTRSKAIKWISVLTRSPLGYFDSCGTCHHVKGIEFFDNGSKWVKSFSQRLFTSVCRAKKQKKN